MFALLRRILIDFSQPLRWRCARLESSLLALLAGGILFCGPSAEVQAQVQSLPNGAVLIAPPEEASLTDQGIVPFTDFVEEAPSQPIPIPATASTQENPLPQLVQFQLNEPNMPALTTLEPAEQVYPDTADYLAPSNEDVGYGPQILPQGLIYRAYLAGEKESRFRSVMNYERNLGWKWDASLGGHVGLFRYGTTGNARPEGFQIDLEGAGLLRLDPEENRDVDSVDFRAGIPVTWGNATHQVKFAYYHLSAHLADEFLMKTPGYPRVNFSRDVLVLGHSYYLNPDLRFYGEVGYAMYSDISLQWEFQFGIDYSPGLATGWRGAPFAAVNAHLREEVNYGGNFVVQAGWAWRRSPSSGLFRIGGQYFTGNSEQFSFYGNYESKAGFGVWYDY